MFSAHAFWPFGRLGIANYFLAIGYLIASGFALQQFLRVRSLVRTWNAHAVFHLGLLLMCISRTMSFGGLSFFAFSSVQDNDKLYPLYILLFTLPEFACLTIYSMLFFHWLEVFTFSHDQFAFSHSSFQRSWLTIASSINFLLYSSQVVLYIMLYTTNVVNQDKISTILTWIVACTSLVLPFCFLIAFFVFATVILSGFPFLSALAQARVRKINFVFLVWTFGRVLRSAMLLLSLHQDWEAPLSDAVVSAIVTALLVLVEIVPFCLSLDWSTIAILLTSVNDNQHQLINGPGLFAHIVDDVEHVSEHSKLFIDPSLVQALEGAEAAQYEDGGAADIGSFSDEFTSQCHARHVTTGQLLLVKKFQLHELGSTSVCDQYAEDLASWSNVDHPHVAKFIGVFRIGFDVFCCTEAQGRTLSSMLALSSRPMPQIALIRIAKQMCRALNFLHTRRSPATLDNLPAPSVGTIHKIGVGHGQLTPSSISINDSMTSIRVCDVGVSRLATCSEIALFHHTHTAFTAPELLCSVSPELAPPQADVFSFGMILYFVLYLQSPHHGKSLSDLKRLAAEPAVPASFNSRGPAVSALRLPLVAISGYDVLFPQLIERCWAADPKQRPSFQQIYQAIDDLNIV